MHSFFQKICFVRLLLRQKQNFPWRSCINFYFHYLSVTKTPVLSVLYLSILKYAQSRLSTSAMHHSRSASLHWRGSEFLKNVKRSFRSSRTEHLLQLRLRLPSPALTQNGRYKWFLLIFQLFDRTVWNMIGGRIRGPEGGSFNINFSVGNGNGSECDWIMYCNVVLFIEGPFLHIFLYFL